jgi:predicted nucleic acid-binding protein
MKSLLLDTNVLIRFLRGDEQIAKIIAEYETVTVPTIVIGEYKAGVDPDTRAGRIQLSMLESFLEDVAVKVVEISEDIADGYARIFRVLRKNGTPIPQNDLWIAACAITKGAVVCSLDSHFANVPLLERVVV